MKRNSIIAISFIAISMSILFTMQSCKKDSTGPSDTSKITCSGGCSSMSWNIEGETGARTYTADCNRTYTAGGNYVETCTGTVTYETSKKTYNFSATYDWPNCKITINVTNVGSCTNQAAASKYNPGTSNNECDCGTLSIDEMNVKYKD
jgi:hypothetical protein